MLVMGAGSGIGRACADAFVRRGAELIAGDIDHARLQTLTRETGVTARFCDVTSEASVAVFAAELINGGAIPEILVNAAGAGYVRTLGMVWLSRELLPAMRSAGGSRLIINCAPSPTESPATAHHPYAASPLAFRSLSEALAVRTKGSTTRVMTVIAPRGHSSVHPIGLEDDAVLLESSDAEEIVGVAVRLMGGPGRAEDVGRVPRDAQR